MLTADQLFNAFQPTGEWTAADARRSWDRLDELEQKRILCIFDSRNIPLEVKAHRFCGWLRVFRAGR